MEILPSEEKCLENLFIARYGGKPCPKCEEKTKYHRVKGRSCFECGKCAHQIYPKQGTIMEKSGTSVRKWLDAIFLIVNNKNRISSLQLSKDINVTYKCAHRMSLKIKEAMAEDNKDPLFGIIEVDETYVGGKLKNKKLSVRKQMSHSHENKIIVMGMIQRNGYAKFRMVENTSAKILNGQIFENVTVGSTIYSDENAVYKKLVEAGYLHDFVTHKKKEYARNDITTNRIENCWTHLKNSIRGIYRSISRKHMQKYLYEAEFHLNNRENANLDKFLKLTGIVGFDLDGLMIN